MKLYLAIALAMTCWFCLLELVEVTQAGLWSYFSNPCQRAVEERLRICAATPLPHVGPLIWAALIWAALIWAALI